MSDRPHFKRMPRPSVDFGPSQLPPQTAGVKSSAYYRTRSRMLRPRERGTGLWTFLAAVCMLAVAGIGISSLVGQFNYGRHCSGFLGRAAAANSVLDASQSLDTAIGYLESRNMTSGSTHVLFYRPECDVGFFYRNLVSARDELRSLPPNASSLEKSNVLMKLRETLKTEDGKVSEPPGISLFPWNAEVVWLGGFAFLTMLFAGTVVKNS